MGLEEVKKIQERYRVEIFEPLGFVGTAKEFADDLRKDPKHCFPTSEALLAGYQQVVEKIEQYLPHFFEKVPETKLEIVKRDCGPACTYVAGTADGARSGAFYVNPEPLEARPRYEQPAFALHEGVPGHHLQNSLCIENEGLPNFLRIVEERRYEWCPARRQAYTAYQEGWALYCETLGEEMGTPGTESAIYATLYDVFGCLSMMMKRAVRMVVDTGIHVMDWTLEQAIEYMERETGMHRIECERECRRYASWPAQAVSYKVGQLCFLRLRRYAEVELEADFDLRWFHAQCLKHGPMPLYLLDDTVKAAVAAKKAAAKI